MQKLEGKSEHISPDNENITSPRPGQLLVLLKDI